MVKKKRTGPTAERYIETTLELVIEQGGSSQVNLREISRRIGCAHTNAYNYFDSREDLLWQAMRRVLQQYGDAMASGLDEADSPASNFRRMMRNLVEWSVNNPGLHRFISSDPFTPEEIPQDIVENVATLKSWFTQMLEAFADNQIDGQGLRDLTDIILGYLDGEVFNLINGRVLPGEDIAGRVINNLERLFGLLTAKQHDGIVLSEHFPKAQATSYPTLNVNFY